MKKILFMVMMLAAVSCGLTNKTVKSLNGEWVVKTIRGEVVNQAIDPAPFVGFNVAKKNVYGNTGCNLLTGKLKADGNGEIDFSSLGATKMLGMDMQTEMYMLNTLAAVTGYKVEGSELQFTDADGNTVMVLKKK